MRLEVKDLHFGYYKKEVLKGINFVINSGEISVILGKNGVGKSTLIESLLDVKKIKQGEILLNSRSLKEYSLKERSKLIAYVPQRLEETGISVYDFLLLGRLPYFNLSPSNVDKEEVTKIIFKFGLERIAYSGMEEISGGERQLVSIARAMLANPSFLLLDEPTSSLDVKNELKVLSSLKRIAKEKNVGILVILHNIQKAINLGDKLLFMVDGEIKHEISPENLSEEILEDAYSLKGEIIKANHKTYIDFYGGE